MLKDFGLNNVVRSRQFKRIQYKRRWDNIFCLEICGNVFSYVSGSIEQLN